MARKISETTGFQNPDLPTRADVGAGTDSPIIRPDSTIIRPDSTVIRSEGMFDPERLRLSQDFQSKIGVRKSLITVPVRKPDRQWFVQVHPDPAWRLDTAVLELKEDRETYLVDPQLWPELPGEVVAKVLLTAVNRQGVVFLWPIRLPGADGRADEWNRSALEGAQLAMKGWVRVAANMSLGAYEVFIASGDLPEPEWPDIGFSELLQIAFKDRFIRDLDHPVIKRLRGQL